MMKLKINNVLKSSLLVFILALTSCDETAESTTRFNAPPAPSVTGVTEAQVVTSAVTVNVPTVANATLVNEVEKDGKFYKSFEGSVVIDADVDGNGSYRILAKTVWADSRNELASRLAVAFVVDNSAPSLSINTGVSNFFRLDNGDFMEFLVTGYGTQDTIALTDLTFDANTTPRHQWGSSLTSWNTGTLKSGTLPETYAYYNTFDKQVELSWAVPAGQTSVVTLDGEEITSGKVVSVEGTYTINVASENTTNNVVVNDTYTFKIADLTVDPFAIKGFGFSNFDILTKSVSNTVSGSKLKPEIDPARTGEEISVSINKMTDLTTVDGSFTTMTDVAVINDSEFDHGLWRLIVSNTNKNGSTLPADYITAIDTIYTLVDTAGLTAAALPTTNVANDSVSAGGNVDPGVYPTLAYTLQANGTDIFGNSNYTYEYTFDGLAYSGAPITVKASGFHQFVVKVIKPNKKSISLTTNVGVSPGVAEFGFTGVIDEFNYGNEGLAPGFTVPEGFSIEVEWRCLLTDFGLWMNPADNRGDDSWQPYDMSEYDEDHPLESGHGWPNFRPYNFHVYMRARIVSDANANMVSGWKEVS